MLQLKITYKLYNKMDQDKESAHQIFKSIAGDTNFINILLFWLNWCKYSTRAL